MKQAEKDKTIPTTPEGVWEGGIINNIKPKDASKHQTEITTDIQGNGYPTVKNKETAAK